MRSVDEPKGGVQAPLDPCHGEWAQRTKVSANLISPNLDEVVAHDTACKYLAWPEFDNAGDSGLGRRRDPNGNDGVQGGIAAVV